MADVLWKECADWLVRCQVIRPDHRVKWETSQTIDLAHTLRDGVLLCHLLNSLIPNCIDLKEINLRPQMSQFLSVKNIRCFLITCQKVFEMNPADLFEPPMLIDLTAFGQVLQTLSKLSNCPKAQLSGIRGFPSYNPSRPHDYYNNEIYRNLEDANEDENAYIYEEFGRNSVTCEEEDIYEDIVNIRKKQKENWEPFLPHAPQDKREHCILELLETEKSYIGVLNGLAQSFKPLKHIVKPEDMNTIFMDIKELCEIHTGFYADMHKACNSTSVPKPKLSDCFLQWKEKFVIYGEYCANLSTAQSLIDELCAKNETTNQEVLRCQANCLEGKFKLRDLLSVPMQRVLKYHLFLETLVRSTSDNHADYQGLQNAHAAMKDINEYINEVKRDFETIQIISDIQGHITELTLPPDMTLKDYGRLLRDGELKIRSHREGNKTKNRYIFIFDRIVLICKATRMMDKLMRGDQYSFKSALILQDYKVEDIPSKSASKDKWGYSFYLVSRSNSYAYTMLAKTEEMKNKWVESFRTAVNNSDFPNNDHCFNMNTFEKPTSCDHCQKLLRGIFYQGYLCQTCGMAVHRNCIEDARSCGAPSLPPRPYSGDSSLNFSFVDPANLKRAVAKRAYRVNCDGHLTFDANDIILIKERDIFAQDMFDGILERTGAQGTFPSSFVEELDPNLSVSDGLQHLGLQSPNGPPPPASSRTFISHNLYTNLKLEEYSWFAGRMDHETATSVIDKLPNGAFLVRISERQSGRFVISLKHENKVKHMKVCTNADKDFYLSETKFFKSVVELVKWYEDNSLSESFNGLYTTLAKPFQLLVNMPEPLGYAVANYDFCATSANMLSLKKGDRIAIVSKRGGDKGWWKGRIDTRTGYFPLAYVTEEKNENNNEGPLLPTL